MITFQSLKITGSVTASGGTITDTYTPADGAKIHLRSFIGEAGYTTDTYVCLIWDSGGGAEQTVWITHGSSTYGNNELIATGDGVKIITLIAQNDSGAAVQMASEVLLKVVT